MSRKCHIMIGPYDKMKWIHKYSGIEFSYDNETIEFQKNYKVMEQEKGTRKERCKTDR